MICIQLATVFVDTDKFQTRYSIDLNTINVLLTHGRSRLCSRLGMYFSNKMVVMNDSMAVNCGDPSYGAIGDRGKSRRSKKLSQFDALEKNIRMGIGAKMFLFLDDLLEYISITFKHHLVNTATVQHSTPYCNFRDIQTN